MKKSVLNSSVAILVAILGSVLLISSPQKIFAEESWIDYRVDSRYDRRDDRGEGVEDGVEDRQEFRGKRREGIGEGVEGRAENRQDRRCDRGGRSADSPPSVCSAV